MVNAVDYGIIALYFGALLFVGYFSLKKTKSGEDYLVAGRMLPLPMFTAAMAAVVIGGGGTLGASELAYKAGLGGFWLSGMYAISVFLLSFLLGTKLSNMRILSTSEGIGVFYGPYARILGAVITLIYLFMIAVLQIVGIGTILSTMLGWSASAAMMLGGAIILTYLLLGGMWAVAMTDVIQIIIMTLGIIILVPIFALKEVGGFSGLVSTLPSSHFDLTDIGFQRIIAYVFLLVPGFLAGQDIWQKAFTAKSKKVSTRGTFLAALYIAVYGFGVILLGMCLYAVNPNLKDTTMVFATAAVTFMPTGLRGLLLAAALAAIMSTANGGILGSATVIYNDLLKDRMDIPKDKIVSVNRVLCTIVTILAVICALFLQSVLVALDVAYAYLSGCIFVPLVFAFLLKKVSAKAGFYSLVTSFITVTAFFMIDGITAVTPIIYGMGVSAITFFGINIIDKKKREITFEGERIFIDGVEEIVKK